MSKKVIIVAAVNGGMQQDREGAKIPITPAEIAEDAQLCYRAGAAIVHVHARDADGRNTGDAAVYSEIISRIRDKCDILIQTTNGIGVRRDPKTGEFIWPTDSERLALLNIEPRPDLYGIAAGSMDFYHPEGGYPGETPYVNSPNFLRSTLPHVYGSGSTVEFELTEVNVVHRLSRLADEGIIDRNASNLWMLHGGGIGNTPPTARALVYSVDEQQRLFPNAKWGVLGAGKAQFKMAALGLAMDCDTVRVGFEDNIYLPDGTRDQRSQALRMEARVNGEVWASGDSSTMLHTFDDMIAFVSRDETLYAGEIFGSGTMGGGCGLELNRYLSDGDIVELEVEHIGILRNQVRVTQGV